jgi:hypothetical protein
VQLSMRGSKHGAADREQTARYHQQHHMKTRSAVRYKRPNKDLHTCASHALAHGRKYVHAATTNNEGTNSFLLR